MDLGLAVPVGTGKDAGLLVAKEQVPAAERKEAHIPLILPQDPQVPGVGGQGTTRRGAAKGRHDEHASERDERSHPPE